MEYVFGTKEEVEILKTKGNAHSDLTGWHQIEQSYPDQKICDHFRIVRKIDSTEDAMGNCYDWYEIDHHYRITDKTGPLAEQAARDVAAMENALCEQDAAMDERMSAIEDALCDLDSVINGSDINEGREVE